MDKNFFSMVFFVVIISLLQFVIAIKHLQFGFFNDDWLFLSVYRSYVANPFLDIFSAWKNMGSHTFAHAYHVGVLFNFFGLNYIKYHIFNQILKIIATLTVYPLIKSIFKNKNLAILATLFYAIHYSPFGGLDNVSRGEDFIAVASMNLFLVVYLSAIRNKISSLKIMVSLAIWLFATIVIDSTRLFPLFAIVLLIEVCNVLIRKNQFKISLKRLAVLFFPFLPLIFFAPTAVLSEVRYSLGLFDRIASNNLQLFLIPFASLGSTYIPRNLWFLFGHPYYETFSAYLGFLVSGPLLVFFVINLILSFSVSKAPFQYTRNSLILNFVLGIVIYLIAHNWLSLNLTARAPVDPGVFILPSVIGVYVCAIAALLFFEWKQSKQKNILLEPVFIGILFSFIFIFLTWVFADLNSIFMGVHPYLVIPAIGTSLVLAAITEMIYKKLKEHSLFTKLPAIANLFVLVIFVMFFQLSKTNVDEYFSYWLNNGLRGEDQNRLMKQFWNEIGDRNLTPHTPILILADASEDYANGTFYSEAIYWKIGSYLDLKYLQPKQDRFLRCDSMLTDKKILATAVLVDDGKKLFVPKGPYNCRTEDIVYDIKNVYSFKLKDRNLISTKNEILSALEAK